MATEADVPEAISIATGEKVDRSLKIEKLDRTDNQCSPGTLNESKGDLDQHPEIHTEKHFADGENVQGENSMEVESKNNSYEISEGEQFLNPLSEISQVEQSNQAGMEIPKNEVQLQKGTPVGGPVETGTEENQVIEERREKFAEDIENHDIAISEGIISEITKTGNAKFDVEEVEASTNETNVHQHVPVISNQQDSIKEDVQCLEKESEISNADIKGAEKADGNAQSYHKEASDLLEATTFQEYEASISTHDVTNSSFKKDTELETNVTSNEEEDSQQTLQDYEQKEELQALPEVTPVDAKIEMAFENAEVISCTEEARAIQNTPEFLEKEEANPVHYPKESESITEKVSEATSIEQESVEHALPEIQTAENQPQEFSEENPREYQASVVAADSSTDKDEKNLAEQAIQENSFSLVEEETAQQLSREEVQATNLKEEEKGAHTKPEEPIEVADTTTEIGFETIEQRTETNKDLYVPIPEEEAYAEESTKAFVEDNSFLSEVIEVKTKEIIQEDYSTVSGYGLVSGEVSQVSTLEEPEAESKEHFNNTPEQKGPQTILTDETVVETEDHAQAGENYNSETIEKDIQTAEDEGNADTGTAPAAGLATIIPDQPALHIEDIEFQTEENVNSKDKSEEQIPAAAYESGKGLIEAETESNEQVTDTDIASEEKDPETTLTDETALDSKDIDVQEERDLSSEENLEKQLPVVEDKGDTCLKEAEKEKEQETLPTTVTREPPVDIEVIDVQAEESFSPKEKLEELIPAAADEGDTGLKEAEEENKEQVKSTDSAPEEKITILTDDRALDIEEVELQVEDNVGSKDNVEEQFPKKAEEGDAGLKEPEEDSKELVSIIDISPEEKGLETILTDETTQDAEDTDAKAGECINSKEIKTESCSTEPQEENKEKVAYTDNTPEEKIENLQEQLEEQVQVVADEGDTCLNEGEEENKQNIKSKETSPEEKGLLIISTDRTALDSDETELQSEENVSSTDNLEKHIPTPAYEAERGGLTEAESEYKEELTITDITPEVDSVPTIFTDQTALESEEIELCAEENVILTDSLEKELPTTADEGEDILMEAKAESKDQVTITDITPEVKGVATILTDERSLETEDTNVQAKESANSNENLEEEITAGLELGDTCLKKENEEESKEQVESSSHEEKGLATILTEEMSQDLEYTDARENFNSEEILEKQIPTAVYEGETDLKEVEAENKEQVETTEIATEEKGLPTILVDETAEGIEVIDVEAGEINSKEVLEKHIPTALDEGETDLKEAEADIKEKGLATILTEEMSQDLEYTDARENFNSEEILEKQIPTAVYDGETDLKEVEAENKEQVETTEIATEEKGLPTILVDETAEGIEVIDVEAGEINSKEVLEKQIPTALDESETDLKEAEADIKEQVETTDIVPDQKGVETILSDDRALDLEDVHVQEQENLNLNENLESQIPTTVGEGETDLSEGEVANKEEVKCTEISDEVKDVTTILRDETALEIQDVEIKAQEPEEAGQGEESAAVPNDIPVNVHNTELVDEVTEEQSYQEPSHEEAEPKITVEDEKSEDNIEMNHMTVEEVLDEPKITSRDFNEEQIIEGNVASSTLESIEEDTVKSSQHNKKETIELKEEGSCTGSTNEESASDHIREYIPEDATEQIKDEDYNAVKSENEILEDSKTIEVHEICETKNIEKSEEIFSTLPVKYDEGQQGEGCSPAPTEALKEENINEDTLSVKVAKDDGNSGAVTIIETSAEVPSNDEDDSPNVLQKYEPKEEITKLLNVKPQEITPGPLSENVEVITCIKEEIQESLNISSGEVLETTTIPEIQIVEDTAETTTKLQACVQTAELNTEGEKENSEEQTSCEVSTLLIVEISEQKKEEEKIEGHVECKDSIEEAKSETLEDTTIQEEESKNSFSSEKEIEKEIQEEYSSTVRNFDSKVKCDETCLIEASTEDKEQVETTQIATEEKGNEGIDVCNTKMVGEVVEPSFQVKTLEEEATTKLEVEDETDKSNDLPEANNKIFVEVLDEPKITVRDFNDEQITDRNVTNLTTEAVEEHETVKDYQGEEKEIEKLNKERSGTENIEEGNANDSSTKCVPGDIDEKLKECIEEVVESKEQITEGNVETLTPESINEDFKNSKDSEKETIELKEEGSCKESIKEENASELSPEYKEDALKSEEEILEDSEIEETLGTLPVVQLLLQKQVQDNIDENTCFVQQTKDNDSAITITETSAEVPSNDEDDSPQVLQKYEPIKEHIKLRDVLPEETKPESSSENAEVVTCRKEEIEESLEDTKESDSTGEASMEATELSNEVEKQEHTTQEVSSSLLGEETTEESSKKEEKMEAHDECIEAIEEAQEESNKTLTDGSILLESSDDVIVKEIQGEYSSTVRSFNSEVVSEERGSTEATEQVEATHIAPEEDIEGTDVYNTELVGETIEPSSRVQTLEEEEAEDETDKADDHPEKSDKICEEVLDKPKITDTDHGVQNMEGNVGSCASGSVEEETVKNDQAECVPAEVIVEECTGETIESKEEFLQESQKDDRDEETFQIKEAGHNDDYNGTVVLPESGTEIPSIGEESSEVTQILELGEEHAQVEASDLADEIEACDLEDKVSFAERTEEMTSRKVEVSNLALEKLNSDAPEEDTIESCEVVPESVSEDEVPVDQKLDEGLPKKPSTLLSEEQELRASEHEQTKEVEVPTEEDTGDLLAARSAKEICLPEEPRELKVSELAPEKLDAGETEEETKETSETVTISDSQNIGAVCEDEIITDQTQCEEEKELGDYELVQETLDADAPEEKTKDGSAVVPKLDSDSLDEHVKEEIIADQTLPEGISTEQLQIPSSALLPEEKELEASEYRHETTRVDKNIEEENPKKVEVPADEDKQESFTSTPTETCLHTEEPRDTELAMHKLDAGESEEEKVVTKSDSQSAVVASGDEIVTDQTVCEEITETPLSQERELGASELALEKLAAVDIEEIKEGPEIVPKFDSGIIEVVSNDEITIDETFNEGIIKEQIQSPSSTLLPEEKEHKTSEPEHETTAQDQSLEQECTTEVELSADEDMQALLAARSVEKECLLKEEASKLNVSELAVEKLDAGDTEESNGTFETVSTSDFPSIVEEPKEEITVDETLSKEVTDIPLEIPSYASLNKEKEPKASELDLEKLDADTAEEVKGSEVIPQSISQSDCEVTKDEIIADQLEISSSALPSDKKELKASEHEHETIINEKNIEDENLKEVKEPTDEASEYVFVARSVEETCLQKEKPSELEVPEANVTEEVKDTFETVSESDSQSINAVSKDDSIADQTVSDVITDMPLDIPLPNKNEEVKEDATELALEKLDTDGTEDVKEGSEVTPKSDLQSIDVVGNDEIITDQVLRGSITTEQLLVQSPTLLLEEKELKETNEHEHGTAIQDKNLEEEYAKETEVVADEDTRDVFAASSEETTHLQKEKSRELKVSELSPECEEEITETFESTDAVSKEETIAEQLVHQHDEQLLASPTLVPKEEEEAIVHKEEREYSKVLELSMKGETEEETKAAFEPVPEVSSQSIGELATDEIVDQIPPSSLIYEEKRCENTTSINNAGEESMNVVETPNDESRKDPHSAEETSIPNEEPRELNLSDLEFPSSQYTERDSSNEEKNLEVATSNSRAEDSCDTPIEANQTAKVEVMNEEIKDEKEVTKDSQLISVDEENVRQIQQQNESSEDKYPEEKNDTFTAPTEYHHEVPGSWIGDIEKEVKPDDKSFKDHSPDEAEGRIQETATHLGLQNQGDEINCGSSTTEITIPVEKASSVEISQDVPGLEEANGTAQDTKQLEKESHATDNPSSKDDALNILQDPKLKDTKPSNDTLVARETKEDKFCESGTETVDSTSAQISLSEILMEESTKERMKAVTHLTGEKEPKLQADEEEEEDHGNVEEAKTDEEKEDFEHRRAYQGYDEPVIVEASRDTEVKVSTKKSHNILSGMGKSVKHSISKVKKAIIGKSSNSKTQSDK